MAQRTYSYNIHEIDTTPASKTAVDSLGVDLGALNIAALLHPETCSEPTYIHRLRTMTTMRPESKGASAAALHA